MPLSSSARVCCSTSYATVELTGCLIPTFLYIQVYGENGTHCNVGKLTFCAVSSASIKCGCTANGFKFNVVHVNTLLSGKCKRSVNI